MRIIANKANMYMKWFFKSWLRVCLVLIATTINHSTSTSTNYQNSVNDILNNSKTQFSSVISHSDQYVNISNSPFQNELHERNRRGSIVQASLRLIDEKQCPEIRTLCTNLRDGADDLPVLECVQTFLSNQIESLSDECQHAIWTHTGNDLFVFIRKTICRFFGFFMEL